MLLEDISPIHSKFKVGDLTFEANDFDSDTNTASFSVKDSGGLEVGRFSVTCDDDGSHITYDDSEDEGTLDRIRMTGDGNTIARNVRRTLESMR